MKYFCLIAIKYTAEGHLHNVILMKLPKCPATTFPLFICRPILEIFIVTSSYLNSFVDNKATPNFLNLLFSGVFILDVNNLALEICDKKIEGRNKIWKDSIVEKP